MKDQLLSNVAFFGFVFLLIPATIILSITFLNKRTKSERKAAVEVRHLPPRSGIQVTGFILGIVTLLIAWSSPAILTGAFGLIFSLFGMRRTFRRGFAIAGLVTCIIGLIISVFSALIFLPALNK